MRRVIAGLSYPAPTSPGWACQPITGTCSHWEPPTSCLRVRTSSIAAAHRSTQWVLTTILWIPNRFGYDGWCIYKWKKMSQHRLHHYKTVIRQVWKSCVSNYYCCCGHTNRNINFRCFLSQFFVFRFRFLSLVSFGNFFYFPMRCSLFIAFGNLWPRNLCVFLTRLDDNQYGT